MRSAQRRFAGCSGCCIVLLFCLLPASAPAQISVPDGFTAQVFFSPSSGAPLRRPTSLEFDNQGRLFVAQLGGRISILEDRDGDGRAEEPREFADGLDSITGLALFDGAVFVSSRGSVVRLRDTDGDGLADERDAIIDGLPTGRHQNNGIAFGPAGKLFHCVGSRSDGSEANLQIRAFEASIVRANPDGTNLEEFARGLRNCYDLAFHPVSGALYATDNGRDTPAAGVPEELNLIVEGGHYGWPDCWGNGGGASCEGTIPPVSIFQEHSSANGFVFYTGTQFPEEFRNNLFIALFGSNDRNPAIGKRVIRVVLPTTNDEPAQVSDFVLGLNNPLDLTVGPDGSIYVADFATGIIHRISFVGGAQEADGADAIQLRLFAERPSYQLGDTIVLNLDAANVAPFDVFLAVLLPDGRLLTIPRAGQLSGIGEIAPFTSLITSAMEEVVLRFPVVSPLPEGTYTLIAVAAIPESDPRLAENQRAFELSNFTFAGE